MCSQQSDYAAGPGGHFGGLGWGVSGLGIGVLQIRHCLGPINVTDLGRGSVSRVPQPYPLVSRSLDIEAVLEAWNFCPYRE